MSPPPAPGQVGHASTQQQEAAERQHVGVHDPGEVLLGEVEPLSDRGQGHVDDRGVEDDYELREAEEGEGDPAAFSVVLGFGHLGAPCNPLLSSVVSAILLVEPEFRFRFPGYYT